MNTEQLYRICGHYDKSIMPYFRGVFAYDTYLQYKDEYCVPNQKMNIFIVNTEPSFSRGKHWLLIILDKFGQPYLYFDSFGKNPLFYGIEERFEEKNEFRVQGVSKLCGLYCVLIANVVANNKSMTSFVNSYFSRHELRNNDSLLIDWFRKQPYGSILKEDCVKSDCISYAELMSTHLK